MSVIYLTFENNGYVKVQKVKNLTNSETKIFTCTAIKHIFG